ncbi:cold-shock protein [Sandaracinobacteroides saxicola]|uniref:Cold-shock protein n=1 Tax=Sandaracinobacteroides saxicola TaxID=2759707 RepID=A0A7G5IJJ4_9SPHN|nr:cold shock domain-containing protein [Sandaracinobacteroides saxicola]QMW23536.1 cold-shock protein [Sandaracinobacteroides saxicola]
MASGEVLWFDEERGFGFIRPHLGPRDVFVHISTLGETGLTTLVPGARVDFELTQTGDGRLTAFGIRLAERPRKRRA